MGGGVVRRHPFDPSGRLVDVRYGTERYWMQKWKPDALTSELQ
jgi:hypothetical protein